MADLSKFDVNAAGNPNNNVFGLPFTEEDARLILLPVPWEVTVSNNAGTARAPELILKASYQVDIFDADDPNGWKQGIYMCPLDRKVLLKSDYLRKEAELFINFITKGEDMKANKFMCKSLKDINEGSVYLNDWVQEKTADFLKAGKLVGLVGGDHSTSLGFWKALGEQFGDFGILQIDAHCDLRPAYEYFKYSHASVSYNALLEIPQLKKLVQVGIRDYSLGEWEFVEKESERIIAFTDRQLKARLYEGENWKQVCDDIIDQLPQNVIISLDIDGLDPKLCRNTGTPVPGGIEAPQAIYLFRKLVASGKKIIGFDLVEIGVSESNWDGNVGAHMLWKLCNQILASNPL